MKRETGYYWVKRIDIWLIAHWDQTERAWTIGDFYYPESMNEFDEIDERRIIREEPCKGYPNIDGAKIYILA